MTGVAGSGKSTLINEVFLQPASRGDCHRPIGRRRVNTLESRHLHGHYGRCAQGVRVREQGQPGLFSFNSKGACENCQGLGVVYTDLAFLDSVKLPCEVCGGKRFKEEVLAYKLNGKSIADVLEMTVEQALDFFQKKGCVRKLQAMSDVGLNYLDPRTAAQHALGRGMPAHQTGQRAAQERQHLRDGRTDDRLAHVRYRSPSGDHEPARRCRQYGDCHRAQPRRDQQRGLDHRNGTGRRQQGRASDVRRHTRANHRRRTVDYGQVFAGNGRSVNRRKADRAWSCPGRDPRHGPGLVPRHSPINTPVYGYFIFSSHCRKVSRLASLVGLVSYCTYGLRLASCR